MIQIILGILFLFIIGVLLFLNYLGFFLEIKFKEEQHESFTLIFQEHIGEYKGTAKIQNDIYNSLLKNHKIKTFKGFGIYYDDPKKVSKENLRSIAGCILEKSDKDKIDYLKQNGFNIKEIPSKKAIITNFPFKNNFSVIVGLIKVYPEIEKYIKKNKLENKEIMEIYDVPLKKITYIINV